MREVMPGQRGEPGGCEGSAEKKEKEGKSGELSSGKLERLCWSGKKMSWTRF